MAPANKEFFSSSKFAVAGASKDPKKFGNKVVKWYQAHDFEVVPIHPKESSIEDISTVSSISDLQAAHDTSLSVITPPQISLPIVKTALLELSVPWIWLQPGAEDDALIKFVEGLPDEGMRRRVIYGGPCILVQGEKLAREMGKL